MDMDNTLRFFPEAASTAAAQVDRLYFFLLLVAAFFTLLIFLLIVFFAFKYRHGSTVDRKQDPNARYWILEITWTLIPLGLTMIMFAWGADLFFKLHQPPDNALEIHVLAKQWMWKIQHPDGRQEINSLHVPVGQPIRLRMISEDVIHSFYVPDFRVKQDVLPGRYTTLWFEPTRPGRYHLFCAEYCGTNHSRMTGEVIVQEPAEYAQWLQGGVSATPVEAGKELFEQFRCSTCHAAPVNPRCPPIDGLFGHPVRLTSGEVVTADETYIRESILDPTAKVVAGYQPVMPTYKDQISEQQILQLIAYFKSLSPPESPSPSPATTSGKEANQ